MIIKTNRSTGLVLRLFLCDPVNFLCRISI